ncbi:Coiled-coil and C2 domain-containing protein 2A [Phytophthora pseudosyringae]|uniref:Coiled-coil and C2 domain-containing protein 2A n=1 Tax=Phytophthora pseudosyringae TaxID=221518 RepID=A0A8T1VD37_9STRA|nr:Coiled-coil and C2 domain-containing protein 2A [Phytophthora pseudosyringae]
MEEDTDGERSKSKRKELRLRSRRPPASPRDASNDEGTRQKKAKSPGTRPRQRSEAKKRNDVEKQRKRQHDTTDRDAHTNNRFLRALSGQTPIPDQVKSPEKKVNEDPGDDSDNDVANTTTRLLAKNPTAPSVKSTEGIIVTPYSGWFPRPQNSLPAAKRWSEQLKQQEAAGLFVDGERTQFGRLELSTLDRLEERLHRELSASASQETQEMNSAGTELKLRPSRGLLVEELLLPASQLSPTSILESSSVVEDSAATAQPTNDSRESHDNPNKAPSLAMLEVFVDRVVLDDHPTFALADRLAAQLRALYTAYSRMQQLQPWQLSLQRLDQFFSHSTGKLAQATTPSISATIDLSATQVVEEANQLLTGLEALSQLHQQILGKANEMRDAGARAGSAISLQVNRRQRTQPIDLSRVDAVLELVESGTDNQQNEAQECDDDKLLLVINKISQRLSTLATTSAHALQTVLQLESIGREGNPNEVSFWSRRFYVALRVNGKFACTTKIQLWSRGEVHFSEKLCFTLPFFPATVCAEVYERRRLLRDELLSTNAVPVVVPGQNVAKPAPSRSCSSLFEGWRDKGADHLVPAASLTPSDEWYQFSSTTPIARTQWHRSFHNAPLFAHASRRTQGRLHLRASWVSDIAPRSSQMFHQHLDDTAYLPPKRPEIAGGHEAFSSPVQLIGKSPKRDSTRLSQYLCDSGFSSERDFLRLVEPQELPLDPNDPENVAVRRLQVYYTQQQHEAQAVELGRRKVFRTSAVPGPLAGSGRGLTKRNYLLRLRDREYASRHGTSFCAAITSRDSGKVEPPRWILQHAVFDEPLPVLEHELLTDERLLRLLRPELRAFDRRLLSEEAERADASIVERHRVRQLLKLQDFRERVRQTQIVSNYNTDSSNQDARAGRSKPLAAIVQEKPLPLFPGTLELPALGALFAPRRRLRPRAKVPAAAPSSQTAAHWPTACTLYVQVQKATNVPVRIKPPRSAVEAEDIETTGRRRRDTLHRTKKSPRMMAVRSSSDNQSEEVDETPRGGVALEYESHVFVQISFQGKTRQTSCATIMGTVGKGDHGVGAHPMWMETVALPFRPPQDDWSPGGIESTQDTIRFSLFDQVTRQASTTVDDDRQEGEERLGAQTRALHRENCFLGRLEVPFPTLYRAGRLEGSLRCQMPIEHLGYANLHVGATQGATSSFAKTMSGPPSVASSDGEAGSPRQRHTRGLSLGSPTRKRTSMSPREAASPRSPEASDLDDDGDDDTEGLGVKQAAREATFLKLTLLLDPVLPVADQTPDHDEKEAWTSSTANAQDKLLLAHAQRWVNKVRNATPASAARRRNYDVFVRNLSHGATFLPRFLRAQSPPVELQSAPLPTLVRYVSLIPFLDDWLAFDRDKDVWSTTQEFLNMGAGDHEEHAVLLANYFMWYDRRHRRNDSDQKTSRSYLALGHAVPEGDIVYVLRRGVLWNASTGVGYAVSDPHCPLRDVSLVVSSKNVFANVQPMTFASGAPAGSTHELNWDIESNTKCWKPLFTAKNISLPPSVQRRELTYSDTSPEFVDQVERELREALKVAVRRWRSTHFATNFNEAAGLQLRGHLIVLEREANGRNSNQNEPTTPPAAGNNAHESPRSTKRLKHKLQMKLTLPTRRVHPGSSVLRELQRSREVCGLPLHASFTDIPRVLEIVENTVRCCVGNIVLYFP